MMHIDPMILKLALMPWEAALYLGALVYYMNAWSKLAAAPETGGEAALGWRHGAQAISVSAAGALIALGLMAAMLLGLAGGGTIDLLPKGMSVLQVIVMIAAFDAIVATGAASVSVAVTPRWMRLEDQVRERAVLVRLMTARTWLVFALIRLVMAGALISIDPAAGMTRVSSGDGGSALEMTAMNKQLSGMQARIDEIAKVTLPALTLKLDEATKELQKAGGQAAAWPDRDVAPGTERLKVSLDRLRDALRTEITKAPADGSVETAAMGAAVVDLMGNFLSVLETDPRSADSKKAETVRALLALLQPLAGRMGVKAMADGAAMASVPSNLPAAITFSFPSGVKTVPAETDDGRPLAAALDAMSAFIRGNPGCLVMVEGHADAKGREDANLLLSLDRAESAAAPLIDKLDAAHVVAVPRGEREPLVKTKDGVENPKNRRVSIAARCPGPIKAADGKKMANVTVN